MEWKNLEDIRVTCKRCGKIMVVESTLNESNGIYVCPVCKGHVNLRVNK